jgi:hypothetical protein
MHLHGTQLRARCLRDGDKQGEMMKLTFVGGTGCSTGPCPAVYETENQTFVIQGFEVDPAKAGITLPPGELMVEIPRYVLEQVLAR